MREAEYTTKEITDFVMSTTDFISVCTTLFGQQKAINEMQQKKIDSLVSVIRVQQDGLNKMIKTLEGVNKILGDHEMRLIKQEKGENFQQIKN